MSKEVFLSHASTDAKEAKRVCEFLESNGIECFIAPRDIRVGNEYAEELVNGIDNSKVMVLMLSNDSNNSPHVLREVERAVSKSIPVLVYKLEDVELSKSMEYFLMTHQWMDATSEDSFLELLGAIKKILPVVNVKSKTEGVRESGHINTKIKAKNNSGNDKLLISILVVSIMVIAVAIVVFVIKSGDNESKTTENIISTQSENNNSEKKTTENNDEKVTDTGNEAGDSKDYSNLQVGDTITFGTYDGEKIEWRVLKFSEDKKEAVLISKDILCMKAYDAAESGKYGTYNGEYYIGQTTAADTDFELQVQVRGNSDWSTSNIRAWLNSEKEIVKYEDQEPSIEAMSELNNAYDNEPGFLNQFTEEELNAIKTVKNETVSNVLSDKKTIETEDRVYLLSADELKWFEEAEMSILAKPTENAIEKDTSNWYDTYLEYYKTQNHYWWLRDSVSECSSKGYRVYNGYGDEELLEANVGLEGYGIRPAIMVYLDELP